VSIASLLGGNRTFAIVSIAMAVVGCWGVSRLLPRSIRAGHLKRGAPHLALNFGFAITLVGFYTVQLGLGIAFLFDLTSGALIHALLFTLVALYGSALARAWEITWIRVEDPEAAPLQQDGKSRSKNH
jgi:amino acid transporter